MVAGLLGLPLAVNLDEIAQPRAGDDD